MTQDLTTKEKNILIFQVDVSGLEPKEARRLVKKTAKRLDKKNRAFTVIVIPTEDHNYNPGVQHIKITE